MSKEHQYSLEVRWTGNKGKGTSAYRSYDRSHFVQGEHKPPILCSSDPAFLGDSTLYNPEELLVASISACHMLWFLHLSSEAGVVVTDYYDHAKGVMIETAGGGGYFSEVNLYPTVTVSDESMLRKADSFHQRAHEFCFIANSVKFPIHHFPSWLISPKGLI